MPQTPAALANVIVLWDTDQLSELQKILFHRTISFTFDSRTMFAKSVAGNRLGELIGICYGVVINEDEYKTATRRLKSGSSGRIAFQQYCYAFGDAGNLSYFDGHIAGQQMINYLCRNTVDYNVTAKIEPHKLRQNPNVTKIYLII